MKISLNPNSYIIIEKDGNTVKFGIKTKEGRDSYIISTSLQKEHVDKIIAELISLRTRIVDVEEREED